VQLKDLSQQTTTERRRGYCKSRVVQLQEEAAQLQKQCQEAHISSLLANLHEVVSNYSGACATMHLPMMRT